MIAAAAAAIATIAAPRRGFAETSNDALADGSASSRSLDAPRASHPVAVPPGLAAIEDRDATGHEAAGLGVEGSASLVGEPASGGEARLEHQALPAILAACAAIALIAAVWRRWWRLPSDRGPAVAIRVDLSLAAFACMIVAGGIGAGLVASGEPQSLERLATTMAGLVAGQLLAAAPIAWLWRRTAVSRATDFDAPASLLPRREAIAPLRAFAAGLVGMAIAYPVLATIGQIASQIESALRGVQPEAVAHDTLRALVEDGGLATGAGLAIALLVVTAIPVCEEVAYRGLLQQAIARMLARIRGPKPSRDGFAGLDRSDVRWAAILLSSIGFALMHATALPEASLGAALATLAGVSIVLGWLYERTGRLWAPIAAHGLFNAINLAIALGSP